MRRDRAAATVIRAVFREPTTYFVLIAAGMFGVSSALERGRQGPTIEIETMELEARLVMIETSLGRPLTAEEHGQVRQDLVDERVLVAEARARGLEDDPDINDFLVQKMLHVLSADVLQPSDEELERFLAMNAERYTAPATVTVDELVVMTTSGTPPSLRAQLGARASPETLVADVSLRVGTLERTSWDELALLFGAGVAELVFGAEVGDWVGPHVSVRGEHWFRVVDNAKAGRPDLNTVREQVRLDWVAEQEEARLADRIAELRGQYRVVFSGDGRT